MRTELSPPPKLTHDDLLKFPDDGQRHELIDGVHFVTPTPITPHQRILGNLYFLMRSHVEHHGGGAVYLSPLDVIFSKFDVVEPDLFFVSDARGRILTDTWVYGSPDLVVEILSPSTRGRDEGIKMKLYERFDVLEYWVIDPQPELIFVYRRQDQRLLQMMELTCGRNEVLTTPLLPGLKIALAKLFA